MPSGEIAQLPLSEAVLPAEVAGSSDRMDEDESSGETPSEDPDAESKMLQAVQIDAA